MNIQIQTQGMQQLQTVLESMASRGVRLRPLMAKLGLAMIASTHENFSEQGRPHWKPLSAKTVRSMEFAAQMQSRQTKRYQNAKRQSTRTNIENEAMAKVRGNKILQRSGALRQSVIMGQVTNGSVEIGSSLPYARIQQMGGKIKAVTIRPKNKKFLVIPTATGYVIRPYANIPERTIPARPYLGLSATDIPVLAKLTMDYIRGV